MTRLPRALRARPHADEVTALHTAVRVAFSEARPSGTRATWDPAANLPGDLGRTVLDAAATALHVLRTYQEGWGTEGFLATATREDALFDLVADLGYRPAPGVAALGFQQLRCREGAGGTVPVGFRLLSPALGEEPDATFETLHPLDIHPAFNQIRVAAVMDNGTDGVGETGSGGGSGDGTGGTDGGANPTPPTPGAPAHLQPGLSTPDALRALLEGRNSSYRSSASAARARARVLELKASKDALKEVGALTPEAEAALCALACATEPAGNPLPLPPSPMQRLLAAQVQKLPPGAKTALEGVVAPCGGSENERNTRLDALATVLDALGEGLARGARDAVVLTEGLAALRRMDQLFATPPGQGIAAAGSNTLRLGFDRAHPPLRAGDWLVIAERVDVPGSGSTPVGRQAVRLSAVDGDVIRFEPPLLAPLPVDRMLILGNIALVSEGRTVEDLHVRAGTGPIVLSQGPLTWLRDATALGGRRPAIRVTVNGQLWPRVERLVGRGPSEPAFLVETGAGESAAVWFGDSAEGAAVPEGAALVLTYRIGRGAAGNRATGRIDAPGGDSPFVESTSNPLPTWGGADGESIEEARVRAPGAVRAMDRAVSFEDLAAVAARFDGVSHARVFRPAGSPRGVVVVVATAPGSVVLPPSTMAELTTFLRARVPPGVRIVVRAPTRVPVRMSALVRGRPGADPVVTLRLAREALGVEVGPAPGLLGPERLRLDDDLQLSEVYGAVTTTEGVRGVVVWALHRADTPTALASRVEAAADEVLVWDEGGVELRYEEDVDR
ncbi:MAG: baseplate J/gp47 family protein [Myxococcota bacterium]